MTESHSADRSLAGTLTWELGGLCTSQGQLTCQCHLKGPHGQQAGRVLYWGGICGERGHSAQASQAQNSLRPRGHYQGPSG